MIIGQKVSAAHCMCLIKSGPDRCIEDAAACKKMDTSDIPLHSLISTAYDSLTVIKFGLSVPTKSMVLEHATS